MRYENREPGHFKFYEIDMVPGPDDKEGNPTYAVRATWGKIGSKKPRSEWKAQGSFLECQGEMERLIKKRLKNKYKKVVKKDKKGL